MTAFRISAFSGMVPRLDARLIGDNQAQVAVNCRLYDGALEAFKGPVAVFAPTRVAVAQAIYRMQNAAGSSFWLTWDRDVDVAPAPVAGDTSQRIYFTGDGEPRVTDFALATTGGTDYPMAFYVLGVFPPATAPTVGHTGGAASNVTRAYAYTFVTQWGEESAPSPAGSHTAPSDATSWDLSAMDVAPLNSFTVTGASWAAGVATINVASTFGLRVGEEVNVTGVDPDGYNVQKAVLTEVNSGNVKFALAADPGAYVSGGTLARVASHNTTNMKKRIYRTLNGIFRFVAEIAAATTTYADSIADTALGEELPTTDWAMPPVGLKGLMTLQNGIMAGFLENELCFAEPYRPYAWPVKYRQPTAWKIVGLGGFASTVVIGTEGNPYIATGNDPATMTLVKSEAEWPCLSKRGMASGPLGVMYPTFEGAVLANASGIDLLTRRLYTTEEWELLEPATFIAAIQGTRYFAGYNTADAKQGVLVLDAAESIGAVEANASMSAIRSDLRDGHLYMFSEGEIQRWDANDVTRLNFDWMSKEFVFARPENLGAAKVDAYFALSPSEIAALQAAFDAAVLANNAVIGKANIVRNGARVNAQKQITGLSTTSDLRRGYKASGTGIAADSRIHSIDSGSRVSLSLAATSSGTDPITFTGDEFQAHGCVNGYAFNALGINESLLTTPPVKEFDELQFTLYTDGEIRFNHAVISADPFRLPAGYKADNCAVRISGNIKVRGIVLGSTIAELGKV